MDNPSEYTLTDAEQDTFRLLNAQATAAKLMVYESNVQLEKATAAVNAAAAKCEGALQILAAAHGMKSVRLSPDFLTLTEQR